MEIEQRKWCEETGWDADFPGKLNESADLLLLFGSTSIIKEKKCFNEIKRAYPNAYFFGCSTSGEINDIYVSDESLILTAINFENSTIKYSHLNINEVGNSFQAGEKLADSLDKDGLKHVLVLSDGLNVNGSELVEGLSGKLPDNVSITGGLSGDSDRFQETYVVYEDGKSERDVVSIVGLYGDRLKIGYGSFGGWDPFGPERLVTRSEGNVLYELDGKSALELYKTYLGEHVDGLPATGLLFPLSLRQDEKGQGVVRTILAIDEEKQSMTFAGDVPEGAYVRLMKANSERLVDGARGAAEISSRDQGITSPDLAILISCVGRKLVLRQRVEEEVEVVRDIFGKNTIMTGFYSYGEISPFKPGVKCDLHNQTMTITTISESQIMDQAHSVLKRQLRKCFGDSFSVPREWQKFIELVNDVYQQGDNDRKLLEKSLELSSNELLKANSEMKAVLQALPDPFFRLDPSGVIIDCKVGSTNDLRIRPEKMIGKEIYEVLSESVEKFRQAIYSVYLNKTFTNLDYTTIIGGAEKYFEVRIVPLLEDQVIMIIRNITEQKVAEKALRDKEAAELSNKTKTEFLSNVSHELRTPLTSVLGFAKIMKKRLDNVIFPQVISNDAKTVKTVRQVGENVDIIIEEGNRLTALINDVLDLAKIEAGKLEWKIRPISIARVIDRSINVTTALFEQKKGVTLIREIDDDLPFVLADRDKLIQVIINFVSNAVKFTEKGSVTCRVKKLNEEEIVFSIIDTGIGIEKSDLPRVFEKFQQMGDTLTDKPEGTGLGLAICKEIIGYHHGRIWAESKIGKGSTFSFTLPIDAGGKITRKIIDNATMSSQIKKSSSTLIKTILIVDDEDYIRRVLREELEETNYDIIEARDGLEAIKKAKETNPDLIVLDVMMPKINGFDVAAVLKNDPQTSRIPIIILSIVEDKDRGFRLGVDKYFTKPIDFGNLLKEIDHLMATGASIKKIPIKKRQTEYLFEKLSGVLKTNGYNLLKIKNKKEFSEKNSPENGTIVVGALLFGSQEFIKKQYLHSGREKADFFLLCKGDLDNAD